LLFIPYSAECPECKGAKKLACSVCDGSGFLKCQECNGTGHTPSCSKCGGTHKIKCSNCDGQGKVESEGFRLRKQIKTELDKTKSLLSDEVSVNFEPEPGKKLDVISSELTLAEVKYTQVKSIQELESILKAIEDAISQINEIKESRIQLESDPNYSRSKESYLNQVTFLVFQGNPEEALVCLDKAIALDDSDAKAWYDKSVLLNELGNPKEALVCVDRAIAIDGRNSEYWFSIQGKI
jgi:tetratricopeptide (TPR) repeat protein